MGVRGLANIITKCARGSLKKIQLDSYKGKTVGIDAQSFLHQIKVTSIESFQTKNHDNFQPLVRKLLKHMGIPCITGNGEAECCASLFVFNNVADAVISNDYDALAFGSKYVLREIGNLANDSCIIEEISLDELLSNLKIDHNQ
ncbi:hypothetical protein MXB_2158, partial [Myxobolus squamalis]